MNNKRYLQLTLLTMAVMSGGCIGLNAGSKAPDFTLVNMSGQKVALSQYRGEVVMLCYWAVG